MVALRCEKEDTLLLAKVAVRRRGISSVAIEARLANMGLAHALYFEGDFAVWKKAGRAFAARLCAPAP